MQRKATENVKLSYWISWAMIAAIAFLVMKFEFPVIPMLGYLKMDFSDVIVTISALVFGPFGGVMVALFKGLLGYLISGANILSLVGEVAAFLASVAFILPIYYIAGHGEVKNSRRILGILAGIIGLTVVMSVANAFVLTPLYVKFSGFVLPKGMLNYIFTAIVPFNLVKGAINGIIVFILMKTAIPQLKHFVAKRF